MIRNKAIVLLAVGLAICLSARGAMYTFSSGFQNGGLIPDNNTIGIFDARSISGEQQSITSVIFTLHLSGLYVDDLSGYLRLGNLVTSPYYDLTSDLSTAANDYTLNLSSTFLGYDPNGTWTVHFADGSPGGESTLVSWSLDITAVPEPANLALGIFGVMAAAASVGSWLRKRTQVEKVN